MVEAVFWSGLRKGTLATTPTAQSAKITASRRSGGRKPERLPPWESIASPSTTTSTAPTRITLFANFLPKAETSEPSPSISGTVPRLNSSIERAPANGLPEASATICMDCRGPHGMNPLSSPTIRGLLFLAFSMLTLRAINPGTLGCNLRSHGNRPSIFMPMTTMNTPAISFKIPCASTGTPAPEPPPNSRPIAPRIKPTAVYETTRPRLYQAAGATVENRLVFASSGAPGP